MRVPIEVRVYRGDEFVDNLSLRDFQLWEDGSQQGIEELYFIKRGIIQDRAESKRPVPDVIRSFYLFFEIEEYTAEIHRCLRYFLDRVLLPGDNLTLITPRRAFRLKGSALANMPVRELIRQAEALCRSQALDADAEYRTAMSGLSALVETASVFPVDEESSGIMDPGESGLPGGITWDALITRYSSLLSAVEKLRKIDERRLLERVDALRFENGRKYALFFYQREPLPRIPARFMKEYVAQNRGRRDVLQTLTYLYDPHGRDFYVDADRWGRALADASVLLHFLLFDRFGRGDMGDLERRRLESFHGKLDAISGASGGVYGCRGDPRDILEDVARALDEYYLLVYTPRFYAGDGEFKPIEIRITDRNYRLAYRAGYVSD
jgi:hypothetical protein